MKSGRIVERRLQVLMTRFPPPSRAIADLAMRCWSTNGPFLIDRDMGAPYFFRRETMKRHDGFFFERVFLPLVGLPHGVTGWRPFAFPSPPPCGWSIGFIAVPRVVGRMPSQRLRPAFPMMMF